MVYFGLLMILIAGLGNPVQTAVNSRMRMYTGSALIASAISFIVGTILLLAITIASGHGISVRHEIAAAIPSWAWMGGVMGVIGLTGNILLFPKLGSIKTVLLPMVGQIVASILIDSFGWFGTTVTPFDTYRAIGLALVFSGLAVYVSGKEQLTGGHDNTGNILWSVLAVIMGSVFAIQPAMNATLATAISSPVHAAFISFATSTVILLMLIPVIPDSRHHIRGAFHERRPWWTWTGGVFGANYVAMFAWFTPLLGVGLVSLTGIFGMLVMSTIIDGKGIIGAPRTRIRPKQIIGLITVLAGIVLIKH